eukprot:Colp12_sorted_trinity150504_noHs@5651
MDSRDESFSEISSVSDDEWVDLSSETLAQQSADTILNVGMQPQAVIEETATPVDDLMKQAQHVIDEVSREPTDNLQSGSSVPEPPSSINTAREEVINEVLKNVQEPDASTEDKKHDNTDILNTVRVSEMHKELQKAIVPVQTIQAKEQSQLTRLGAENGRSLLASLTTVVQVVTRTLSFMFQLAVEWMSKRFKRFMDQVFPNEEQDKTVHAGRAMVHAAAAAH